ncbi:aspartyl protease family protein At5g10770-like isoform X1 [Telopea speciosissima]|uniref:aspartyl protease family protein At5g10770-like isoform X1 n=1 Tax=Telopea speciosissima TaxID=54955 RepID=UPI001CC47EDC|nr:aspartyl protease family protein At5g10770-like isoform X1 [Telopea speciosissima]
MAINHSSFLFLLLSIFLHFFLFGCSEKIEAYKFGELTANLQHQSHVVSLKSLMPSGVCSTQTQGSKTSSGLLQVAHKNGPCSSLKKGNTKVPNFRQILIDDQTRVKSIHSKISNHKDPLADSAVKIPATSGQSLGTGNYVVNIGIGSPKQQNTVVFDTGSDLTWIQCQPCVVQCYSQQDPIFNPSSSTTYSNISCNSVACSQLQSATGNTQSCRNTCIYLIQYGDGSYSQGYFGTDTLTLSSSDVFPKFQFGCGENNQGLFGSADGLLGLGRDQVSVVSQTSRKYGKLFSYCLPASTSSTGFLAFGSQVGTSSTQYTSLMTDSNNPSFYFLTITGISVGGKNLGIPQSVFTTSGTIIDSGTVITRLAPAAYSALSSAFRRAMTKYRTAPAYSILDTCYNLNGYSTVTIPTIAIHFTGGTDLNVDQSGILVQASSTQYCLAFAGNNASTDVEILGNMQQQTFEVVYNVASGKVGFGAGACS